MRTSLFPIEGGDGSLDILDGPGNFSIEETPLVNLRDPDYDINIYVVNDVELSSDNPHTEKTIGVNRLNYGSPYGSIIFVESGDAQTLFETIAHERIQTYALQEIIAEQISNGGLLEAKQQVELMEDGSNKTSLMSELVDRWASYDPEGAAEYVQSLGDKASSAVKSRLLGEWAEKDPAAAAAWLNAQDVDERTLRNASTAIIREWTRYDMAASAEWLNAQPASDALDRAVMSYTYRAAQEDPASAMTWAQSIGNNWMRTRMMRHVAGNWKNDNPEAFQEFIENADMNDDEKKSLQAAEASTGGGRYWR